MSLRINLALKTRKLFLKESSNSVLKNIGLKVGYFDSKNNDLGLCQQCICKSNKVWKLDYFYIS